MKRIRLLALGLILSLATQFAAAADCGPELTSRPKAPSFGLNINIEVTFDPQTGRPQFKLQPGPGQEPVFYDPHPAPEIAPREQADPAQTLGAHFHSLMLRQSLISQRDHRLGKRNLLVANGGLCASTCGVNVVHAMVSYSFGQVADFTDQAGYYLHRIVEEVQNNFRTDARMGLRLNELASGMYAIAQETGLKIHAEHVMPSHYKSIRLGDLIPEENELIIASIRRGSENGKPTYHAIVITGASARQRIVSYSDPNYPNSGEKVSAAEVSDVHGHQTIRLNVDASIGADADEGTINDLLRVKMVRSQDLSVELPALARRAVNLGLVGRWIIVDDGVKKSVQFLSEIKVRRRDLGGSFGYVMSYQDFNGALMSTWSFDSIVDLQPLNRSVENRRFKNVVGSKIKIEWQSEVTEQWTRQIKQEVFEVVAYAPKDMDENFPLGSLTVIYDGTRGARSEKKIPLEFIKDFKLYLK